MEAPIAPPDIRAAIAFEILRSSPIGFSLFVGHGPRSSRV
jgi:hypothetical protein